MAVVRLLTTLVALVLILAHPRDADAGSGTCDNGWDYRVTVFACGPYQEMRDANCQEIANETAPDETAGCDVCADICQSGESGGSYYWCRASSSQCNT